jgi:hypothetical protein
MSVRQAGVTACRVWITANPFAVRVTVGGTPVAVAVTVGNAALYLEAGGSLGELQTAMGHADPRTTRRYDRARRVPGRSPGHVVAWYLAAHVGAVGHADPDGRNGAAWRQSRLAVVGTRHAGGGR